jgi:hypothetical protein
VDKCALLRFAPYALAKNTVENTAAKALKILQNSIFAMSQQAPLAIALTAGWDSRLIVASALNIDNKQIYILNHATSYSQVDKKIAQAICKQLDLKLNIINYQSLPPLAPLPNIWKNNLRTQMLSQVSTQHFPQCFILNGNVSEVVRGFYDPLPQKLSAKDLLYILGIASNTYVEQLMVNWLKSCADVLDQGCFSVLDLLYWEHKMPNWAAEAKSIANHYGFCLSPFNNRELLCIMASVPRENRQKLNNKLYAKMLLLAAHSISKIPINPTKKENKIRLLQTLGLYKAYRYLLFRTKKLKF